MRDNIKNSSRGVRFTVYSLAVRREFIDYVDAHDIHDPPDEVPVSISNVADRIEAEMSDGQSFEYLRGSHSQRKLVEIITLAIEKQCRNNGLAITIIGALLTILGTVI